MTVVRHAVEFTARDDHGFVFHEPDGHKGWNGQIRKSPSLSANLTNLHLSTHNLRPAEARGIARIALAPRV